MAISVLEEQELDRLRKELAAFVLDEVTQTLVNDPSFRQSTESLIATRFGEILDTQLASKFRELAFDGPPRSPTASVDVTAPAQARADVVSKPNGSGADRYLWLAVGILLGALATSIVWYWLMPQAAKPGPVTRTAAMLSSPSPLAPASPRPTGDVGKLR
jgi:hypothetical protein